MKDATRIRAAQKEMVDLLLDKCRPVADLAVKAWIDVAYHSAARPSECCALDWSDIDWARRKVTIRNGKGGKRRTVDLAQTYGWLEVWHSKAGRPISGPVFKSRTGKPWTSIRIQRVFRRLSKLTGLKLTPHSLRHGAACQVAEIGEREGENVIRTVAKVQQFLGHANAFTTWTYLEGIRQTGTPVSRMAY